MNATLIGLLFVIAAAQPHAVSMEEFLEKECNKGVGKDYEELADLKLQLLNRSVCRPERYYMANALMAMGQW